MMVVERRSLQSAQLARARIPRRYWDVRLPNVVPSARETIRMYLVDIVRHYASGTGLLVWGANGCGKTSVAVLVAMEAMRHGGTSLFVTAEELRQAKIDAVMFDAETTLYDRALAVDFLIVDDMGKEHRGQSKWAERMLEQLFRQRSGEMRPTIVTTNILPLGLKEVYSNSLLSVLREVIVDVEVSDSIPLRPKASLSTSLPCQG